MRTSKIVKENKKRLEGQKAQYGKDLRRLKKESPLEDSDRLSENAPEDDAQELVEIDISKAAIETVKESLEEVEEALARIKEGKYCVCKECGKEIPIERLKAYPAASLCIDCEVDDVKSSS